MVEFKPLVTCVIPVYNAEDYLIGGIESLLSQTYPNVEIILVDDCSTDTSWNICLGLSELYPNVRAFKNKENSGGPLRGREKGIKESRGEWITFMDCDDYVKPTYIEHLVDATDKGIFDIAVTGHSRLYNDGRNEDFLWNDYSQTTDERLTTFYEHFLMHDIWTDPTDTVGQNLIRASVCKSTDLSKYTSSVYAEDTLMALAFLSNSKNGVNFVDHHDFVWRQIEGSGSHGGFSETANKSEFYKACSDIFYDKEIYNMISANSPKVSVVVPVYNVEPYLEQCLDSILNQSYGNLEVILVNDGSTDASQKIINKFKKKESRIRAITQQNMGLNMARAAGVKIASGQYITFVDSDDIVDENYIKILYECLVRNDVDISIVGLSNFTDIKDIWEVDDRSLNFSEQVLKNRHDSLRYYLGDISSVPNVHQMTAWGKLYAAEIVKSTNWSFSNYKRHEDNLESLQWYSLANKGIAIMSVPLYFYRKNPDSITQVLKPNVNPLGETINYFEFIDELYEKIKAFIKDDDLDLAILNQFAYTNKSQVLNFYVNNQLDEYSLRSASTNWEKILTLYTQIIKDKDRQSLNVDVQLRNVYGSMSWKITKPLRLAKKIVKKLKK
jgi:glycosyltransferase involved in cell wall biosynthesis